MKKKTKIHPNSPFKIGKFVMVLQHHAYGYVYANECFERKHGDNDAGNSPTRENSENGHSFTAGAMQF